HAIGIEDLVSEVGTAFIASTPEDFCPTVYPTIHALVTASDRGGIHLRNACNLFGKELIPELPVQVFRQVTGDGSRPTTDPAFTRNEGKNQSLVSRHSSAGFRLPHQKHRRNHTQYGHPEKPKTIDIRQHGGLPQDCTLQDRIRASGTPSMRFEHKHQTF